MNKRECVGFVVVSGLGMIWLAFVIVVIAVAVHFVAKFW